MILDCTYQFYVWVRLNMFSTSVSNIEVNLGHRVPKQTLYIYIHMLREPLPSHSLGHTTDQPI